MGGVGMGDVHMRLVLEQPEEVSGLRAECAGLLGARRFPGSAGGAVGGGILGGRCVRFTLGLTGDQSSTGTGSTFSLLTTRLLPVRWSIR